MISGKYREVSFFVLKLAAVLVVIGLGVGVHAVLAGPWGGLIEASCQWDCAWYNHIAAHGYSPFPQIYGPWRHGQADWAFFPLYPVLVGVFARAALLDVSTAGYLLNIAVLPFLIWLCAADLRLQGQKVGVIFVAIFCVLYPFNIWFFAQYSEGVFSTIFMAAIVSLRCNRIFMAAVFLFLLGTARPTGFVLAVCIAGYDLTTGFFRKIPHGRTFSERGMDALLLVSAAGAGVSVYVLYLNHLMGDGFAFLHVQTAWHRRFRFFWMHIIHAFGDWTLLSQAIFALASFIMVVFLFRLNLRFTALIVGTMTLLACSTGTASIERYIFSNPLVIEAACSLVYCLRPRRRIAVMAGLAVIQFGVMELWFAGSGIWM